VTTPANTAEKPCDTSTCLRRASASAIPQGYAVNEELPESIGKMPKALSGPANSACRKLHRSG
jgi:hypothetical protein